MGVPVCDCIVASAADDPEECRIEIGSRVGGLWVGALVPAVELALTVVGPWLGGALVGLHAGVANPIEGCGLFVQECPFMVDMGSTT